jgi:hypothetical protein
MEKWNRTAKFSVAAIDGGIVSQTVRSKNANLENTIMFNCPGDFRLGRATRPTLYDPDNSHIFGERGKWK